MLTKAGGCPTVYKKEYNAASSSKQRPVFNDYFPAGLSLPFKQITPDITRGYLIPPFQGWMNYLSGLKD
uniref:Uncharacterized protein n=1 Tax=Chryseobacterium endophyticum TaxID=1854762 RepID=A0AAU6WJE9_9FLAO